MQPRYYQKECASAIWQYLKQNPSGNPVGVIPTGGGKTLIISMLTKRIVSQGGRVAIVTHRKELVEQNAATLLRNVPGLDVGVCSAGCGRWETNNKVVIGGVQTICNRPTDLGKIDAIIVDEAQLMPAAGRNDSGQYQTLVRGITIANPRARVIGFTATPYRLNSGLICSPENIFNDIAYQVGVLELIKGGYLSPLSSKRGMELDSSELRVRGGEFTAVSTEAAMIKVAKLATDAIAYKASDRKSILIFCSGVAHASLVEGYMRQHDIKTETVIGDTPKKQRQERLDAFKNGDIQCLVNVDVLTVGFDAPNVDCVCLLRPTMSPGLYYQMVGRGFRISPGKMDCLVLDFGENIQRHGPVDCLLDAHTAAGKYEPGDAPVKLCPVCKEYVGISVMECPECQHQFPEPEAKAPHKDRPEEDLGVLSDSITKEADSKIVECEVMDVEWTLHTKRDAPEGHPKSLKCAYLLNNGQVVCDYVNLGHQGYARQMAESWWMVHSPEPVPANAEDGLTQALEGMVGCPATLTVDYSGKWPDIIDRGEVFQSWEERSPAKGVIPGTQIELPF